MLDQFDLVTGLTAANISDVLRPRLLRDFAREFGWRPSDVLLTPSLQDYANAHLVVEHGLEFSAVITFLRTPIRFADLGTIEKKRLFSLSYNNLVDWHLYVQPDEINAVYNRSEQPKVVSSARISRTNLDALRREAFEQVIDKRPNPNFPALDDALIKTISLWRRQISAELGYSVPNDALSALFNSIIFVRAAEDQIIRAVGVPANGMRNVGSISLLERITLNEGNSLSSVLLDTLRDLVQNAIPDYVFDPEKLAAFDALDRRTITAVIGDFYRNRFAPYYDYDFSIISKHALSRIYESYVSVLRYEPTPQATLFPDLPNQERDKAFGSIYTPQYIARFFARFLESTHSPAVFQRLRVCDPACGSGIFLRTLVEIQAEPQLENLSAEAVSTLFSSIYGIDVDENAAQAARLSLALLHLVLTNNLPLYLNIQTAETIEFHGRNPDLNATFDAVIANPPFVALDVQSAEMRARVAEYMAEHAAGRIDMYLPFLKIALELLKPGGLGLFVLPQGFLTSKAAAGMRALLSQSGTIRLLADFSAIRVFGDVGSYVVLLIFQKRGGPADAGPATIIKCQDFPGQALEDALEGRHVDNSFYSVYEASQKSFSGANWVVLRPAESRLLARLDSLPTIDKFLHVALGVVSGADPVFVLPRAQIPAGEEQIFVPYLSDRRMLSYRVPLDVEHYIFYPFVDGKKLTEQQLEAEFPLTWAYLNAHKPSLSSRSYLGRYRREWWEPMWLRSPETLLRPKLVSPNLVLVPRVSYDREGKYAIPRSPYFYPKESGAEDDLLLFFLAVLNSSVAFWYMSSHSASFRGGYAKLEPKTIKKTPVPDPSRIDPLQLRELLALVELRLNTVGSEPGATDLEDQIDELVTTMYGLSRAEREALSPQL
jgi:hypothetical protein